MIQTPRVLSGVLTMTGLLLVAMPPAVHAQAVKAAGAWDRSIALETSNELAKARSVLIEAYGQTPESYDVTLRLGWLSLKLKEADQAISYYIRASKMPDATADAKVGLASSMALAGYQALARGDVPSARARWLEALGADPTCADARAGLDLVGPSTEVTPELWYGYLNDGTSSTSANAFFLAVPYRANDHVTVRGAYRRIQSGSTVTSSSLLGTHDEFYGAMAFEQGMAATEFMGLAWHDSTGTIPGFAGSLRLGGRYGVTAVASGFDKSAGWNRQLLAQAFAWPTPWLALALGARTTGDPDGSSTSVTFGATLKNAQAEVDVRGHAGKERWAFSMAAPMIMSFSTATDGGATVTAFFRVSRQLAVGAQAQFEHLLASTSTTTGQYVGVAVGVRWLPSRGKETK